MRANANGDKDDFGQAVRVPAPRQFGRFAPAAAMASTLAQQHSEASHSLFHLYAHALFGRKPS